MYGSSASCSDGGFVMAAFGELSLVRHYFNPFFSDLGWHHDVRSRFLLIGVTIVSAMVILEAAVIPPGPILKAAPMALTATLMDSTELRAMPVTPSILTVRTTPTRAKTTPIAMELATTRRGEPLARVIRTPLPHKLCFYHRRYQRKAFKHGDPTKTTWTQRGTIIQY